MSCAAVILTAGASTRMGRAKALLVWRGRSLLSFHIDCFVRAGCDPVIVVVGQPHEALVRAEADACSIGRPVVVTNPNPSRGMLSSLQIGMRAALDAGADRVVFGPVDSPLAGPDAIVAVLAESGDWVVPVHDGCSGHPAMVSSVVARALLDAPPTSNPRDVLAAFPRIGVQVSDSGVCGNLNTPADLERWRARQGNP